MIVTSTLVALPLLVIALVARRLRSDLEEVAWRMMAIAMLAAPLASFLPKIDIGFSIPFVNTEPLFTSTQPELPTDSDVSIAGVLYGIVALLFLARLAIAAASAWKLRRDAKPFGLAYLSPSLRLPVTAGVFAPAILLPADAPAWSAAKLAAVLAHERAHVTRRDPLWRFIGRLATAVCWFHPLAWLAAKSIERIAEERADQEAVAVTGNRPEYANVILDFLRAMTGDPRRILAAGILDGRAVGARIDAILQPRRTRRSRLTTRVLLATLVAAAIITTGMTTNDAPPPERLHRAIRTEQQQRADEEFFRKRDEIRNVTREHIRNTARALTRGLFRHFISH
jgi:hypothetical protein